ncbi:hypothetical protein WJX72_006052 [[Myrmecia] bisecta]|uniref:Uncharacterized protein n=1 Tax=[Myrmecia] bisecta TaxID=41462 RepID=A0AAW1PNV0_9CHLO
MKHALDARWTHKGLQGEHEGGWTEADEDSELDSVRDCCGSPEEPATAAAAADAMLDHVDDGFLNRAKATLRDCSVLVGMHPDQAVEYIVDYARKSRKPFAVVPCCVYFNEFPWRRLPDGTPVKKYSQLVQYLAAIDPEHIKVAELPFEGRNKVVYCTSWTD